MFFKTFKKNLLPVLIVDILFFLCLFLFFFFSRMKLKTYLTIIQGFSPALTEISQNEIGGSEQLILNLNQAVNNAFLFAFLIIPVVFFLLYTVFQGLSWHLILKSFRENITKHNFLKGYNIYIIKFFFINLIPFALLFLFIYIYLTKGLNERTTILLLIGLILIFYLAFVQYAAFFEKKIAFKENFILMKRFMAFPLFLFLFTFFLVFLGTLSVMLLGIWSLAVFLVLDLLLIELLRFYFIYLLEKKV